jgi:hypothetical protein
MDIVNAKTISNHFLVGGVVNEYLEGARGIITYLESLVNIHSYFFIDFLTGLLIKNQFNLITSPIF